MCVHEAGCDCLSVVCACRVSGYPFLMYSLQFQVSSLADELSRKLQFLHVSTDGIADMQVLQIQVKVCVWVVGGGCWRELKGSIMLVF